MHCHGIWGDLLNSDLGDGVKSPYEHDRNPRTPYANVFQPFNLKLTLWGVSVARGTSCNDTRVCSIAPRKNGQKHHFPKLICT